MATLLPDPPPAERRYTIVSVDDHLVEPAHLFEGRMPERLVDVAPRIVVDDAGNEAWAIEGKLYSQIGLNAVIGRPKEEWSMDPARFDQMRPGCYDPEARLADMDLDGVWASLCFPSLIAGFGGGVFARLKDHDLGLACVRAWNDWHIDEWCAVDRRRIIPLQLTWLHDPEIAAAEIRANAERGFKAVSFPENPVDLMLPSVHTDHWDPFLRACEDTGTVVCLHTGSSSWTPSRSPGAPLEQLTTLFNANAFVTATDWLWAGIPWRFPDLQVAFSEGGIGWVAMMMDRIDWVMDHSAAGLTAWKDKHRSPVEAMRESFWFCAIDPGTAMQLRERIGVDRICIETDYPHADSTWPHSQALASEALAGLTDAEVTAITWANAARLFDLDIPAELQVPCSTS